MTRAGTAGTASSGPPPAASDLFFAEGYTGDGFHEWLCLQNPGDADAVELTFLTQEAGALAPVESRCPPTAG